MKSTLRYWQQESLDKFIAATTENAKNFLDLVSFGGGKTLSAIAKSELMLQNNEIDRIIAVTNGLSSNSEWSEEFKKELGISMIPISKLNVTAMQSTHLCMTWHSLRTNIDLLAALCERERVLVIFDEQHHASTDSVWGDSAYRAFRNARYRLILTATPYRSDEAETAFLQHSNGRLAHPENATYKLSYGTAVKLGYCVPILFHKMTTTFNIPGGVDGEIIKVSKTDEFTPNEAGISYEKLWHVMQFDGDGITPSLHSVHAEMVRQAQKYLAMEQQRTPTAAALVVVKDIVHASYMKNLIEMMTGGKVEIVHSEIENAQDIIAEFKVAEDVHWIVSVAMITESTNIKRLKVLLFLPYATTELFFNQAMGRIVRILLEGVASIAHCIMPDFACFIEYAKRIEESLPPDRMAVVKEEVATYRDKTCPYCLAKTHHMAKQCEECGYSFSKAAIQICPHCEMPNRSSDGYCFNCSHELHFIANITLSEIYRDGTCLHAVDMNEEESQFAEELILDAIQTSVGGEFSGKISQKTLEIVHSIAQLRGV